MKKTGLFVALMLCAPLALAAEQPAGCAKPDLSGQLPVPDYLDSLLECAGMSKPASAWYDGEAQRYTAALSHSKFPWLVLPAQTQFYGFDRIERSLIGAEVAAAVADPGAAPDVMLVARALGEPRRRYLPADVQRLAKGIGARKLLEVYAGHDGNHHLTLTLLLKSCSAGDCKLLKQHDWRNLSFSDTQLPFLVIRGLGKEIRAELSGLPVPAKIPLKPPQTEHVFESLAPALIAGSGFESNAAVDGWLASLVPIDNPAGRERLQVMALRSALASGDSPTARVLAAHAAMHLHRRPYALSLLQGIDDSAAAELRELLNGNLPESQAGLAAVKSPLLRLLLSLDVQSLAITDGVRPSYDRDLVATVFGSAVREWQPLIERRLYEADDKSEPNTVAVKSQLDATVAVPQFSMRAVAMASDGAGDLTDVELAAVQHVRAALAKYDVKACCAGSHSAAWAVYWLLDAATDANVFRRLYQQRLQLQPVWASIERLDPFYSGNPRFEWWRANVASGWISRTKREEWARFQAIDKSSTELIAYWAQGQDDDSNGAAHRLVGPRPHAEAYLFDFPMRTLWMPNNFRDSQAFLDQYACTQVDYDIATGNSLAECIARQSATDREKFIASASGRFHGNYYVTKLIPPAPVKPIEDAESLLAEFHKDIAIQPLNLDIYDGVGTVLIKRYGRYEDAQRVFLSAPELKSKQRRNPGELSLMTWRWAEQLAQHGRPDLAQPIYQITADLNLYCSCTLGGEFHVALAAGSYPDAIALALARAQKFKDADAYRDYLSLMHVTGDGADANVKFREIATQLPAPQAWQAAIVGHRMEGRGYKDMKAWLLSDEIRNAHYFGQRFAPYYALQWMKTDRRIPADFPALMQQIERDAVRFIDRGVLTARPHPLIDVREGYQFVSPSTLRVGKTPVLPDRTPVSSEYVLLANALAALDSANYPAAVAGFTALADRYPIESEAENTGVALSYFALAAAKTGDQLNLEQYIEKLPFADEHFDIWLSRAYFAAVRHDVAKAELALTRAFNQGPVEIERPVSSDYMYLEACEIVARETGDARFTRMALEWAKKFQQIEPWQGWGYAVEAQYSTNPEQANRALAMALYLDPGSPRLQSMSPQRIADARTWLKIHNPFLRHEQNLPQKPVTRADWKAPESDS